MGWTTLSVRDETLERFNDTKADANDGHVPEQSADLFLGALLDTWDAVDDGYYNDNDNDADVGGPKVDDSEIARAVARELDYAHLAGKVADEVEGRMR